MNKKVSTLLATGLVFGSLFGNSLLAENLSEIVGNGEYYKLIRSGQKRSTESSWSAVTNDDMALVLKDGKLTMVSVAKIAEEDLGYAAWKVEAVKDKENFYTLVNAKGEQLTTGDLVNPYIAFYSKDYKDDSRNVITSSVNAFTISKAEGESDTNYLSMLYTSNDVPSEAGWGLTAEGSKQLWYLMFNAVPTKETGIDEDELNSLYNTKGFSFDVDSVVDGKKRNVENIFNQRMIALDVKSDVVVKNEQTDKDNWGFPAGTYFVTKHPEGKYSDLTKVEDKYEYLKQCTFIAVSSTDCVEASGSERAQKGRGFQLVEITGDKLNKYMGDTEDQVSDGNEVSVYNACFTVSDDHVGNYPFSVAVKQNFRYLKSSNATGKDAVHVQIDGGIALGVIEHGGSYYLATTEGAAKGIFKFGESGLVDALTKLLKKDGAAVYNIKFVSGEDDTTEKGKYLTAGVISNAWDMVAKGEALAKDVLATPAYQFVITNVNTKTNEVTFTNRESGTGFTAKLFDEGNGTYSLAVATNSDKDFKVANIGKSSYGVSLNEDAVLFNDALIELSESAVDPFAGFWNVADGTMVTMAFGRDIHNTSNLLYAYVDDEDGLAKTGGKANLTSEQYDAAQWRLTKVEDGIKTIKRDYVYNNNGKLAVEPFGDVISAQKYLLEYVNDAEETGKYLTQQSSGQAAPKVTTTATGNTVEYIIRENADGSVAIITENSMKSNGTNEIGKFETGTLDIAIADKNEGKSTYKYAYDQTYDPTEDAKDVKTYLLTNTPYKYWENAGHVTIQSEVGNYLSMNDDRDAVMVDNDGSAYYLFQTDADAVTPSYYITKGIGNGDNGERLFLFNTVDSVNYQMDKEYDPKYQWRESVNKLIFKTGIINADRDTLTLTVKGEADKKVADKQNNQQNVWGGLNRFKFQIVETEDADGYYYIRQQNSDVKDDSEKELRYLGSISEKLTWTTKDQAIKFNVEETAAPTANEGIATSEIKVVAQEGAIVVKNAAGKNVVVSTILGQVVANEVVSSDNATISVPAGIVVVSVEGESFKVNVR